jgi:hypothetical protein
MDYSLEALGGFAKDVASSVTTVKNAFKEDEPADRKEAKAAGAMNHQTIALALGGVLVVAIILRIAFRK